MLNQFGKASLNTVKVILEQHRGKTVDELYKELSTILNVPQSKKNHVVKKRKVKRCPSCKDGILSHACGGRLECKCGYSEEIK